MLRRSNFDVVQNKWLRSSSHEFWRGPELRSRIGVRFPGIFAGRISKRQEMLVRVASRILLFILFLCLLPVSAWAAEGTAESWGWAENLGRWFNLLVLLGVIAYFTREPIGRFLQDRREGIRREITEAREARAEAEQQLAEAQERIRHLEDELAEIRHNAQAEAEAERERLLAQAEQEAKRILASATREIDGLSRAARQDLRNFVAKLSVELAEEQIKGRLDPKGQKRIVDRFIRSLGRREEERPS